MKQLLKISSIFLLLLLGCKREQDYCVDEPQISYKYISKASLELTQYFTNPKFDTISFSSSKGDTLIFVRTKTDSTWYDDKKYSGVPGCGPYEIQKNLEITNYYSTIKGDGIFKVKHSKKTITIIDNSETNDVIEIYFLKYYFIFYENHYNWPQHPNYIGNFSVSDTTFSNVFYQILVAKGYMAPNFGLIEVEDSLNLITYQLKIK